MADSFFADEPENHHQGAALEILRRLLVWIAEGTTLHERGLRSTVALYCIRPDLINGATLEKIGDQAGCTRQMVHKLTQNFRLTTGLALWK